MNWFKLYEEFAHDPKVQIMPEHMQRRLIMIFCLRCNETLETLRETEVAFALRISEEELQETKELFLEKNFIDEDWNLINWDKRQTSSNSSTQRVRRYRERMKKANETDETLHETNCNALDKNREDKNKEKNIPKGILKKKATTKKLPPISLDELSTTHIKDWLAEKRSRGKYLKHDEEHILETFKNYCKSKGKTYKDYISAYKNAFDWERCKPQVNDNNQRVIHEKSSWGLGIKPSFGC